MYDRTTMAARRARRLAATVAATIAAICILGSGGLASAATTAPAKGIRPAACRPWTFNVHYGSNHVKCYAGHGTKSVGIHDVHLVATGNNSGSFTYIRQGRGGRISFHPREILRFPATWRVELVTIRIK